MTGYQSKKLAAAERHADPVTIDHIIELRKRITALEKKLEDKDHHLKNALDAVLELRTRLAFQRI